MTAFPWPHVIGLLLIVGAFADVWLFGKLGLAADLGLIVAGAGINGVGVAFSTGVQIGQNQGR